MINALVTRHVYTELVADGGVGATTSGGMIPVGQPVLPPNIDLLLATGQLPQGDASRLSGGDSRAHERNHVRKR